MHYQHIFNIKIGTDVYKFREKTCIVAFKENRKYGKSFKDYTIFCAEQAEVVPKKTGNSNKAQFLNQRYFTNGGERVIIALYKAEYQQSAAMKKVMFADLAESRRQVKAGRSEDDFHFRSVRRRAEGWRPIARR